MGENLCCVGILGWSENERMMDYGGVVERRLGKMKVLFYFYFFRKQNEGKSPE